MGNNKSDRNNYETGKNGQGNAWKVPEHKLGKKRASRETGQMGEMNEDI